MKKYILISIILYLQANRYYLFEFNEYLAKDLAAYSFLSYVNDTSLLLNNCGPPCQRNNIQLNDLHIVDNQETRSRVILGFSPKYAAIVVAFRGSKGITNWINNINTSFSIFKYCNCEIHSGFKKTYESLESDLTIAFKKLKFIYPFSKVFVTGHSLGGVLATLSIPLIYELHYHQKIDALYTYGQPKIGKQDFANWFDYSNFVSDRAKIYVRNDSTGNLPNTPQYSHTKFFVLYDTFLEGKYFEYNLCYELDGDNCQLSSINSIREHQSYYGWDWKNV